MVGTKTKSNRRVRDDRVVRVIPKRSHLGGMIIVELHDRTAIFHSGESYRVCVNGITLSERRRAGKAEAMAEAAFIAGVEFSAVPW